MYTSVLYTLVFAALTCVHVNAYGSFMNLIPNGYSVGNPCLAGQPWSGVGHKSSVGGGNLNSFGRDFDAAGRAWTVELCLLDSDGDTITNGQELGDPGCVWSVGSVPTSQPTGHPGICQPVGSTLCQHQRLTCQK